MFTFAFIFTLSLLMLFLAVKILKQDFTSFNPFTFQPVEDLYDKLSDGNCWKMAGTEHWPLTIGSGGSSGKIFLF